jgi:spiro-SPASM protein
MSSAKSAPSPDAPRGAHRTAAVVNALLPGSRWMEPICGMNPIEELRRKLLTLAKPGDLFAVVSEGEGAPVRDSSGRVHGGFRPIPVRDRSPSAVFKAVSSALAGYEHTLYLFADAPLLDTEVAAKMLELHRDEFAEYTYGEGFPAGVSPEILKAPLFARCASLLEGSGGETERCSLFCALSKEINSFDIETFFAPENLSQKRIELSTSLKRNRILVERVATERGMSCGYGELCSLFKEKPGILRTVPSYAEVEITNRQASSCLYSPLPFLKREAGDMPLERYETVLDALAELSDDVTVSLSYLGEPLLHPRIREVVERGLAREGVGLILETDGTLFDPAFSDFVAGLKSDRLSVIFDLDAVQDGTYAAVRGKPLRNAERNIRYLLGRGVKNVYAQLVRMDLNEGEMLPFLQQWEKEGAKVIIQKYNSFIGTLPDRARYDLRPLERMPCWHLLRDVVVFRDGRVPRCKQDLNGAFDFGRIPEDGAETVWEKGLPHYLEHCGGRYDESCSNCDEFFTFNL